MSIFVAVMEEKFIVVCYDIIDDRRRNRVAKVLADYGVRVQYSVFECMIPEELENDMKLRILDEIDEEEDKVHFYFLCKTCLSKVEIFGNKGEKECDEEAEICYVI